MRATVIAAEPNGKLFDVTYRHHTLADKNGNGLVQSTRIGPRGGNKTLRVIA